MTISILYEEASNKEQLFLQQTGVDTASFNSLLPHFTLYIPLKLKVNQRLFAALYQEKHQVSAKSIGKLLEYSNASRDGANFIFQAKNALIAARAKRDASHASSALVQATPVAVPEIKPLPLPKTTTPRTLVRSQPNRAPILISYRNEQGKNMHGAFYDHYTIRHTTQRETYVSAAPQQSTDTFISFVQNTTFALGIKDGLGDKIIPGSKDKADKSCGLLVIPGHASDDKDTIRLEHERFLIAQARNRGQPVLALCAGSWRLWAAFGGTTEKVSGHLYSKMPHITTNGGIGNNKQIHRIKLEPNTLVASAMSLKESDPEPTVNSVHWMAPNSQTIPPMVTVSATAVADATLAPSNRQGIMTPEESIEAFETKFGAPMIGVQWHPEAYYRNKDATANEAERHLNLIRYMAKAGDSFQDKRLMMEEFHQKKTSLLAKHGLFNTKATKETADTVKPSLLKQV